VRGIADAHPLDDRHRPRPQVTRIRLGHHWILFLKSRESRSLVSRMTDPISYSPIMQADQPIHLAMAA
jgi:type IV secretory pathway protease TraF